MQVRLGFASMIQADADIYLVDEVLAVGDARFQEKCFDTFRRLKREGTHGRVRDARPRDASSGSATAPCCWSGGEVVADGDPREVIAHLPAARPRAGAARPPRRRRERARAGATARARVVDAWFEDARRAAGRPCCRRGGGRPTAPAIRFEDGDGEPDLRRDPEGGERRSTCSSRTRCSTSVRHGHVRAGRGGRLLRDVRRAPRGRPLHRLTGGGAPGRAALRGLVGGRA